MQLTMIRANQERLLFALAKLHFLTVAQFIRLYYRGGSASYVHQLLKDLSDAGYVDRFSVALQSNSRFGSNPLVYTLSHLGVGFLRRMGIAAFQTRHQPVKTASFLWEVLAINDFLIAATLLSTAYKDVTLPTALHERTIRHTRFASVIPDAWMLFHVRGAKPIGLWLEMDRGTEQEDFFREKIRKINEFSETDYTNIFGRNKIRVAVATLAGEKRLWRLLRWIEQETEESYAREQYAFFRITQIPPGELDPRVVFLTPIWYTPHLTHNGAYLPRTLLPVVS